MESSGEGEQEREERARHMSRFSWSGRACARDNDAGDTGSGWLRKTWEIIAKNSGFTLKAAGNKYYTHRTARRKKTSLGFYEG